MNWRTFDAEKKRLEDSIDQLAIAIKDGDMRRITRETLYSELNDHYALYHTKYVPKLGEVK